MSNKPTTHSDLIEPLQNFLETITQELTEQKFVPALREELKRLVAAMDNIQQSEDTLQQIARGVERLREVFAPAGNRLLEGVKDIESLMRANADRLKENVGDVLANLMRTHEQLEGALRSEAGLLQERTSAGCDALNQTVADVEARLEGLAEHVDGLCRKLDVEVLSHVASATLEGEFTAVPLSGNDVPADVRDLIARSEQAIIRQLEKHRKDISAESQLPHDSVAHSDQILKEIAQGLEEAARKYSDKLISEGQSVRESVTALQKLIEQLSESERDARQEISRANGTLDFLIKSQQDVQQDSAENRKVLADLSAEVLRTQKAAASTAQHAIAESRSQRERIEASLKEFREYVEHGQAASDERVQEMLGHVTQAWAAALQALRDFVQETVSNRSESIVGHLKGIESQLSESGQAGSPAARELQCEMRRVETVFGEGIESLKSASDALTAGMQGHVKAVAEEVGSLRTSQGKSLTVLKDAIKANYDENAARLKEVIESAYDGFVKQTASLPQALDRYSHLLQSLHQGDQLALQGIASDTHNVLALATDKFDLMLADSGAMKKFFPLLEKKLEKHTTELETIHKAQSRADKDLGELKSATGQNRAWQEEQNRDLKNEIGRTKAAAEQGFEVCREDLAQVKRELLRISEENLPAFRREVNALLVSKLDFIESTLHDRQDALRKDILDHVGTGRKAHLNAHWVLAGLIGFSILLQLIYHFARTPGVGH